MTAKPSIPRQKEQMLFIVCLVELISTLDLRSGITKHNKEEEKGNDSYLWNDCEDENSQTQEELKKLSLV